MEDAQMVKEIVGYASQPYRDTRSHLFSALYAVALQTGLDPREVALMAVESIEDGGGDWPALRRDLTMAQMEEMAGGSPL